MATGHIFHFWGGEILATFGATWFVSYAYYEIIDKTHKNWTRVKTYPTRRETYSSSREYHTYWLEQIANMNDKQLSKNTIGLDPIEIKRMAKEILDKINEE